MIPMSHLKVAVEEALAYLRTVYDVQEAEVFVASNGVLLTRLNYTSAVPSNGLEEPKSQESYGIGLRAAFRSPNGLLYGFGSEPSDISLEGVQRALEKARKGAVRDTEFVSLPKPTGEVRTLTRYHDPAIMRIKDDALVENGWQVVGRAMEVFSTSEELLNLAGSPSRVKDLGVILGGDVTILQERMAIASYTMPKVQADESTLIMSFITAMVEEASAKGSGWHTAMSLRDFSGDSGREAARNAVRSIGGVRVKDGVYKVVLGRQAVTDLLHNLILPGLQLGLFYASASPFQGKLTKPIASEVLNIYDHGALPGLAGSKGITCEGLPTGRTQLVKDGVLVGLMSHHYEYQRMLNDPKGTEKLGVDPREHATALTPRNGFRFSRGGGRHFDRPPGTAGTNIIVEGTQKAAHEDLLRAVGDGLYIGRIWYTYPINGITAGDFTCTVVGDSFLIKDGKLSTPIKPNTIRINDSIHNILNNVLAVGSEGKGTIVWAADQIVHAPEMAVANLHLKEIAGYMENVYPVS